VLQNRLLLTLLFACSALAQIQAEAALPDELTAEQDRERLLQLLGITELRRGADSDPASEYANYDESKADENMHTLPDPLLMDDGQEVKTADDWWSIRRPQIVEHFDREIYGRMPTDVPGVEWIVQGTTNHVVADTPVVTQSVSGIVDNSAYSDLNVEISLTITRPASLQEPVPVILDLTSDPAARARRNSRFTEEQLRARRGGGDPWQDQVIERGWAYAVLVATSVQADNGDGLAGGIIGLANNGVARDVEDWGALRAWGWGVSRALDFIETQELLDATRVGIEGHSRYGKAALLAMAYEPRLAVVFVSSSGEGGAKLWRHNYGEQTGNIASSNLYHWMAGNFFKYAGPLAAKDLPVDAHELIALCAPRPVFISAGNDGDQWVDPKGMFLAAAGAGPVYELLGRQPLGTSEFPPLETTLMDGDISFRQHNMGHTPGPNWPHFLDFAARYFEPE